MGPNTSAQSLFFLLASISPAQARVLSINERLFRTICAPDMVLDTGDSTVNRLHVASALKSLRVLLGMCAFPGDCPNNPPQTRGLKKQNFIVS